MKQFIPVLLLIASCSKSTPQTERPILSDNGFALVPQTYFLSVRINEISGIADSRLTADHIWAQEDGGNPAQVYLIRHEGSVSDSILIDGATNRDWEDIAVAGGPDNTLTYLYIGDIGDNELQYPSYTIYRMPEPSIINASVSVFDRIDFTYPDGSHDAEAFLVDDASKDIYIITKRDAVSKIYKLPFPQNTAGINEAVFVANLKFSGVVSASLSMNGRELMVKTYTNLYYYERTAKEGLDVTLGKNPSDTLAYELEVQGEAVCFMNSNGGFFTISEEANGVIADLKFYRRE